MLSTRSNLTYLDPSIVPEAASEVFTETCFAVAFVAFLVYGIIIMMDKEVRYFWTRPITIVHIIYFTNRYPGVLCAIAFLCCIFATWTRDIINWLILIMFDYILMMRVLVLYSRDRKLERFLKILLILEATTSFAITIYGIQIQEITVFGLTGHTTVCGENDILPLRWGIADWSISAAYGVVLLALALYKAVRIWRDSAGLTSLDLVKTLIRDQIIYFLLIILVCIFNIMQFKVVASNMILAGILEGVGNPTLLCIAGSRMLINLKEAGARDVTQGTSYCLGTISSIQFTRTDV